MRKLITILIVAGVVALSGIYYVRAGTLEFDGVPVDITTTANEDLVICPGEGGNTQIGDALGENANATDNDGLHVTGVLESDGIIYADSGIISGSGIISDTDSTGSLGSSSIAWLYLYADNITTVVGTDLRLIPASGAGLISSVSRSSATGNEVAFNLSAIINKATSGNYTGLKLNVTETFAPGTANKLLDLQRGGTSYFQVYNGLSTVDYGLVSVGNAAWDGSTSGYFSGSSNGTQIAGNAASDFTGNLMDLQIAGSSKFSVDADGNVTAAGNISGSGAVNGSGTANRIAKWSDSNTLTNAGISDSSSDAVVITIDSSENVGIGTTSPGRPFEVYHPTSNIVGSFESGDDHGGIALKDNETTAYLLAVDNYLSIGGSPAFIGANLNINTGTGNVGIGTTAPSALLTTSGIAEQLRLEYNPYNYQSFTVQSDGDLHIAQNGSEATLALTYSGSVGIGTTAPGTLLQLEKDGEAYLTLKNATDEHTDGAAETRIIFEDHLNTALAQIQASHSGILNDTKGDLIFSTHNGTALTEAVKIDSGQIATFAAFPLTPSEAPLTDYQVANKKYVDDGIGGKDTFLELTDTPDSYTTDGAIYVADNTNTTVDESAVILSEGINTFALTKGSASLDIAPAAALDVNAGLTVESASIINQDLTTDASPTFANLYVPTGGFVGISAADGWTFDSGNDISTTSNVGIGTASPKLKLDVSAAHGLPATSGTSQTGMFRISDKNTPTTVVFDMGITGVSPYGGWLQATDSSDLSLEYPLLLNPNGGNVGIGTTDPGSYKLYVNGSTYLGGLVVTEHGDLDFGGNLDMKNNLISNIGHADTDFTTGGGLNIAGSVGIGTTAPGTLLQLEKDGEAYLTLKNATDEHTDGAAETRLIFEDHLNTALAQIQASHDGTEDDTKGDLILFTHNGTALTEAVKIDSGQVASFAAFPLTPSAAPLTDYQVANKKYVDDGVAGKDTFLDLTDTPGSYTADGALYVADNTNGTVDESTVILSEGINTFAFTKGSASLDIAPAAALDVDAGLTVESASLINQDLTTDASPTFANLYVPTGGFVGISAADGWTFDSGSDISTTSSVGIGTTGPGRAFHIQSSVTVDGDGRSNVLIQDTTNFAAGVGGGIIFGGETDSTPTYSTFGGIWGEKENATTGNTAGQLHLGTTATGTNNLSSDLVIDSTGNVGIGTTDPQGYKLYVDGSTYLGGLVVTEHGDLDFGGHLDMQNNLITNIGHANTDFTTGGGLNIAGSVGIGTTAPGTLLQLEKDGEAYLTLKNATDEHTDGAAETRIIFEDHLNTALAQIQASHSGILNDTKGDLIFSTHNGTALTEAVKIDSGQIATFAAFPLTPSAAPLTDYQVANKKYVDDGVAGKDTFLKLTDTPDSYTTDGAIYVADNTNGTVDESTVILSEGANTFAFTKGSASLDIAPAAALDVNANLTVENTSLVNQDLTTDASPTFANLYVPTGGFVGISASDGWTFDSGNDISTSSNLGIGTTSPASLLDITKAAIGVTQADANGLSLVNTTAAALDAQQYSPPLRLRGFGWETTGGTSQSVDFRAFVRPIQGTAATGGLDFQSSINGGAYSDLVTILSNGNVGIGTTDPGSYKLYVNGSTYLGGLVVTEHGDLDFGGHLDMQNNLITNIGNENTDFTTGGGLNIAGSVGIGTTAPGTLLQLEKDGEAYLTLKNATDEHTDGAAETRIIFEDHLNTALAQIQASHSGILNDTKGDLIFSTHNGTALTEAVKIDSGQIATFSAFPVTPSEAPLTDYQVANKKYVDDGVAGKDTFLKLTDTPDSYTTDGAIYVADNTNGTVDESTVILSEGANTFAFTKGSASLDIAPAAALDVNANLTVENTSLVNQDLTTDASPTFANLYVPTGGFVGISASDGWTFDSGNDISTTSSVGIGTINPGRPLGVYHATTNIVGSFESGTDRGGIVLKDNDTTAYLMAVDNYLSIGGSPAFIGTNLNINTSTGSVGIGTTSPDEALHLQSSTASKPIIKIENTEAGTDGGYLVMKHTSATAASGDTLGSMLYQGKDDGGTDTTYISIVGKSDDIAALSDDASLEFQTMKAGTITSTLMLKSGNVAIGTTDPQGYKLYVDGSTYLGGLVVTEHGDLDFGGNLDMQNNLISNIGHANTDFTTGGGLNIAGNVGIGTTSPGTLLQLEKDGEAYLTLKNATDEHTDGAAETRIIFEDHLNTALAQIQASHSGILNDTKGDLIFSTHNGTALTEAVKIDSGQIATFAAFPVTPSAPPLTDYQVANKKYVDDGVAGKDTFLKLTDTPDSYTTDGAIYVADNTNGTVDESTVILSEGANTFAFTKGSASLDIAPAAALDVNANLTVENTSLINQDLTTDASPTFANLYVPTGGFVGISASDGWIFDSGNDISTSSNLGIGTAAPARQLEIAKSAGSSEIELSAWSTTDTHKGGLIFQKSASAAIDTLLATAAGEDLGRITANGVDTTLASRNAAQILFEGDAAPDADATPGRISFWTADTASMQERVRIDDSGSVGIGTASPSGKLQVVGDEVRIGDAGTVHYATGDGDLYVEDALEVDGNVYLGDSTADSLAVSGYITSDLLPDPGSSHDLGSSSRRWAEIFADDITVTNLYISSTDVAGTTAGSFTVNTDNDTADTEDSSFVFERGAPTTNTTLLWNSTDKQLELNAPVEITPDAGITSSGTAALIVNQTQAQDIFTASVSGTPKFVIDNSGKVGIGTTTPAGILDVAGGTAAAETAGTDITLQAQAGGSSATIATAGGDIILLPGAGGGVSGAAGSVGIGTTGPTSNLEVKDSSSTGNVAISSGDTTIIGNDVVGQLNFKDYDADAHVGGDQNPIYIQGIAVHESGGASAFDGSTSEGYELAFATSIRPSSNAAFTISEAMRIDKDGNVGIGTTDPGSYKLYVNGSTYLGGLVVTENGNLDFGGNLDMKNNLISNIGHADTDFTSGGGLNIAGSVGIGMTGPDEKLEVFNGNLKIGDDANTARYLTFERNSVDIGRIGTAHSQFTIASLNANDIRFYGNSTDEGSNVPHMIIKNNGNVGIGTTTPGRPFGVYHATTNIVGSFESGTDRGGIALTDNDTTAYLMAVDNYLSIGGSPAFIGTNLNINTSTGNVGIGTTGPTQGLDVRGTSGPNGATTIGVNATDCSLVMWTLNGDEPSIIWGDSDNNKSLRFGTGSDYTTGAGWDEKMRIDNNGNVGIGTTSPGYRLQLGTAGSLADSIRIGSYAVSNNTRQYIGYARADSGLFESAGNGDTPSTVMAGVSGIRIVNTVGTIAPAQADNSVQLLTHIYNGSSRVALHANYDGNVGIGKTNPGTALDVNGVITATGGTSTNWNSASANSHARGHTMANTSDHTDWPAGLDVTELSYVNGVTSAIQTQLGLKAPLASPTFTGNVTMHDELISPIYGDAILNVTNTGTNVGDTARITLRSKETEDTRERAVIVAGLYGGSGGYLSFWTRPDGSGINEKMRILGNGNVGIGKTNPGTALDVNGVITATGGTSTDWNSAVANSHVRGHTMANTSDHTDWPSGLSVTELSYVNGVTSAIQTQLGLKAPLASPTFTGNVTMPGTGIWNSSGNVGIGTTSPSEKLTVNTGTILAYKSIADNDFTGLAIGRAGGWAGHYGKYANILFTNSNSASDVMAAIGVTYDGEGRMDFHSFYHGDYGATGALMSIRGNGNVGINDSTPTYKLDVNGTLRATGAVTLDSTLSAGATTVTTLNTGQGAQELYGMAKDLVAGTGLTGGGDNTLYGPDGDVTLNVGAGDGIDVAADSVAVDVTDILGTGLREVSNNIGVFGLMAADGSPTNVVYVNNAGNVGIGTTGPTQVLDVRGTSGPGGATTIGVNATDCSLVMWALNGDDPSIIWGDSDNNKSLRFGTGSNYDTGAGWDEKMRIDNNGNVGIGTTDPQGYKLYVNGSTYLGGLVVTANGDLDFGGNLDMKNNLISNIGNANTDFTSGGGLNIAGNVGIGTAGPQAKLDVGGQVLVGGGATNYDIITVMASARAFPKTDGTSNSWSANGAYWACPMIYRSKRYPDVGGGAFPDNKYGELILQGTSHGSYNRGISFVTWDGSADPAIRMRIKENGNVGIGTTNPGTTLDVNGVITATGGTSTNWNSASANSHARGHTMANTSDHTDWPAGLSVTELSYVNGVTSAIQTQLNTKAPTASPTFTGNVTMPGTGIWNSSGNVGIGTTNPASKLEINDATFTGAYGSYANERASLLVSGTNPYHSIQLSSTYNSVTYPNYGLVLVNGPSTTDFDVWGIMHDGPAKTTGGLQFAYLHGTGSAANIHTATPMVTFQKSGNVGINDSTPTYKLDVNGTLRATGAVTLNSTFSAGATTVTTLNTGQGAQELYGMAKDLVAGAGLTGGGDNTLYGPDGDVTLNVVGGTCITANANDIAVTANSIGDTQLAYNTGQHLTTGNSPSFTGLTLTDQLNMAESAYEGSIVFGTSNTWHTGIRQHDDGDAELRIWAKSANGMIFLATGYDGEPASIARPTDGLVIQNNNVGIGNFSSSDPAYDLHVKGTGYFTSSLGATTLNTGQGAQELYGMAKDLITGSGISISGGGNNTLYGPDGDITISHADTSSQATVNNSGGTVIQDITLDTYGHATGLVSYNLDGRYYTESEANSRYVNVTGDTMSGNLVFSNYGLGVTGVYSSTKYQQVFGMGTSYTVTDDGTSLGSLYGIAWTHSNVGGESISGLGHQALFVSNGDTRSAIGDGIWTKYGITGTTLNTGQGAQELYGMAKDLVAGTGLTGGGNNTLYGPDGDVTLNVGAGDGIDVAADSVAVDVTDILGTGLREVSNNIGVFGLMAADGSPTNAVYVNNAGNVGIGTTGPAQVLDVRGTSGPGGATTIGVNATDCSLVMWALNGDDPSIIWGDSDNNKPLRFGTGSNYDTGAGWNEKMRIDNNGNVGIGTTSPEQKLDLAIIGSTTDTNSIRLGINNGPAGGGGTAVGGGIIWKTAYGSGYTKRSAGILQTAEGNYFRSGLAFFTNGVSDATTDWSERMRITMGGDVGIGTTDPQGYKLYVNGSTYLGGLVVTANGDLDFGGNLDMKNNLISNIGHANTDFTSGGGLNIAGNVGIGTVTPSAKLAINGGLHVGGDSNPGDNNLLVDGTATANSGFYSSNAWYGKNSNYDTVEIKGYGSEMMIGAGSKTVYVNYRDVTAGVGATPNNWVWYDGIAHGLASHTMGVLSSTTLNTGQGAQELYGMAKDLVAGTGLTGGGNNTLYGPDGDVTLNVVGGTCITANANDIAVTANSIGDTQLAYNTGQHLTTGSDPSFRKLSLTDNGTSSPLLSITADNTGPWAIQFGRDNMGAGGEVKAYHSADDTLTFDGDDKLTGLAQVTATTFSGNATSATNADTLDGIDSTYFNRGDNGYATMVGVSGWDLNTVFTTRNRSGFFDAWSGTNFPSGMTHVHGIQARHNSSAHYGWQLVGQYSVNGDLRMRNVSNNVWSGWYKVWTEATDGSGSGLNADLLDGQSGAYYLDNTDTQDLGTSGNTITLTNSPSITAPYATSAGNADTVDSVHAASFLRSDTADTFTGTLTMGTQKALVANNYGRGVYGLYDSYRYQHVWSMGTAYNLPDSGSDTSGPAGNLYGLAWSYPRTETPQAISGLGHQLLVMINGYTNVALGTGIWTSGGITGTTLNTGQGAQELYGMAKDLVAGTGLTGGGNNTLYGPDGDVTLNVGAGDGIDVAADSVAVDVTDILGTGLREVSNNIGVFGLMAADGSPTNVVYVNNAGNVGIGTTTPGAILNIKQSALGQDALKITNSVSNGVGVVSFFQDSSCLGSIGAYSPTYPTTSLQNDVMIASESGDVLLQQSGGKVGIGTSSPANTLDVYGGIDATSLNTGLGDNELYDMNQNVLTSSNVDFGDIYASGGNIDVASGNNYYKYGLWGEGDTNYCIGMHSGQSYGGLNDYAMTFSMNDDWDRGWLWRDSADAANDGAMSLTTGGVLTVKGNVGIGTTTTPTGAKLVVQNSGDGLPGAQIITTGAKPGASSTYRGAMFVEQGGAGVADLVYMCLKTSSDTYQWVLLARGN